MKANGKKAPGNKAAAKKPTGRKYGPAAGKSVEREIKAMKEASSKAATAAKGNDPKQALAIGLSEARRAGDKVPPPASKAAKSR